MEPLVDKFMVKEGETKKNLGESEPCKNAIYEKLVCCWRVITEITHGLMGVKIAKN